jgi:DsbC/DsbD-like thiol-disulfide interchange protein/cytochrome c biogenesis protein CcdA
MMLSRLFLFLCIILAALSPIAAKAQMPGAPLNVPATLEAETKAPAPGQTVTVAFHFKPKPGWHGYWLNPGDAGFGMLLDWTLPKGVALGELHYPVPEPLIISGLMNHVFEREYAVLVDLKLDQNITRGTKLPISVKADWLACTDEICVPEGDSLTLDITAGEGAIKASEQKKFDAWRSAIPVPMDQNALYRIDGKKIEIAIPYARGAAVDRPYFFPVTEKLFRYPAPQTARRTGDWLILSGEVRGPHAAEIKGVLRIGDSQGLQVIASPGAIPSGGDAIATAGAGAKAKASPEAIDAPPIWTVLGLAILGGLILNLMPCVFPILGLKALALAKAGGDERAARRDAVAYTAGIMISCLALGAIMLSLRALGQEVGWAFQLQEPVVILLLLLLMIGVTANLLGMFEIAGIGAGDHLARQGGIGGSFWTGVLAAIVATPCTGPFMATAMGAALLLPPVGALLVFAGLGLGLALPFLGIAFIPPLRNMMPRPGAWMITFRKAMAIPMALTALALCWLLWRVGGWPALLVGGIAGTVLVILLTRMGSKVATSPSRTGAGVMGLTVIAATALYFSPLDHQTSQTEGTFSEVRLQQLQSSGTPVFVYFTADWCVTCKVNETGAIDAKETMDAFRRKGIVTLVGDYTRRDPAITRFLAKHGRSGVPLYLFYGKEREPEILPQILSVAALRNLNP